MKLKLAKLNGKPEIFHSIQGEGISMGKPSIFVRTSLCNLHCIWCDTDYTWNWIGTPFPHNNDIKKGYTKFDKNEWLVECSTEAVFEAIRQFPCKNIILTGGEPMMQQRALTRLMQELKQADADYTFEVETNGTYQPKPEFEDLVDQFNVSPKLENSGNPQRIREKAKVYRHFAQIDKAYFKFVLSDERDLEEVLDIISKYKINKNNILLMPEASNANRLHEQRMWLTDICKQQGLRYSDRLHVQIWGEKRGV